MKNGTLSSSEKKALLTKSSTTKRKQPNPASSTKNPTSSTKVSQEGKLQHSGKETLFEKLFQDMLKDIYWAEQHLVKALQKMSDSATTGELKNAFEDHLYETQKHVSRLEKIFGLLGKKPEAKKCEAMEGLVKEAERVMQETRDGSMTRDAALIISAQKAEHYEIAAYGSLVQVAYTLGHDEVADILARTLRDEEDTDFRLTDIAESYINPMADEEGTDEGAAGTGENEK